MGSDWLNRVATHVVLGAYLTQVFAPVVQACERELPVDVQARRNRLPTLSFRLENLSAVSSQAGASRDGYRLSVAQTTGTTADHAWHQDFYLENLNSLNSTGETPVRHPWEEYLTLQVYADGLLKVQSVPLLSPIPSSLEYQSFHYRFEVDQDLHLANLLTAGLIQVQRARIVSAQGTVEGQAGIRLNAQSEIRTRSWGAKERTRLLSHHIIGLHAPYLDNEGAEIVAPRIIGRLGQKGQRGPSLDNTSGKIVAAERLKLNLATEVFNDQGVLDATAGSTEIVSPEAILNRKGVIAGKQALAIRTSAKGPRRSQAFNSEELASHAPRWEARTPPKIHNRSGILKSRGDMTLSLAGVKNTEGASVEAHNLHLPETPFSWDETSWLNIGGTSDRRLRPKSQGAQNPLKPGKMTWTLPPSTQVLLNPLIIDGQVDLTRAGTSAEPLHFLADILAKKGVTIRVPRAPLLVGTEREHQRPIHVRAEEGFLETQSKSLDWVKAQVHAKTGMRFEVQEKPIPIGRGVVSEVPRTSTYDFGDDLDPLKTPHNKYMRVFLFIVHTKLNLRVGTEYLRLPEYKRTYWLKVSNSINCYNPPKLFEVTYPYLFKESNGTLLSTQGPFTVVSPEGAFIDQSEIYVSGNATFITKSPVRNEGGTLSIQGNLRIGDSEDPRKPGGTLQNILLKRTTNAFDNPYFPGAYTYAFSRQPEVLVGGDLEVQRIENIGGFIYYGGKLNPHLSPEHKIQPLTESFIPTLHSYPFLDAYNQEKYSADISSSEEITLLNTENPQFQGVLQSPRIVIGFKGKAMVGAPKNYRRPPIPPFQKMKSFLEVARPTALYRPNLQAQTPWINQPTVPLRWTIKLPPAVGLGPKGLFLLGPDEKLLYHPWQEVDNIPRVFHAQVQRGYLDAEYPQALDAYLLGRYTAYEIYLKYFAPKALASAPQPPSPNPERSISNLVDTVSEEDLKNLKFMMLYQGSMFEGKKVYLPLSWLSDRYDNPQLRNADGGMFGEKVIFKGLTDADTLLNLATIYGEKLVYTKDIHRTINERQSYHYIGYYTNTTIIARSSWRGGDKVCTETFAYHHKEPQPTTGHIITGKDGQAIFSGGQLENINGGKIAIGEGGCLLNLGKLIGSAGVSTQVKATYSEAGGSSVGRYVIVPEILPASITSTGGIQGRIGELLLQATNLIAYDKNIDLLIQGDAHLLTRKETQSLGATVTTKQWTVTVHEGTTHVATPCAVIACNGKVILRIEGKLFGVAPQFYGHALDVEAKEIEILIERLNTQIHSKTTGFANLTTWVNQTVKESHESALHPSMVSTNKEEGSRFASTAGSNKIEAPILAGNFTHVATGGSATLGAASLNHTVEVQTKTASLSNGVVSSFESALQGQFGEALKSLANQFPLLTTLQQVAQAKDTADVAAGTVKTLYQSYQFLKDLKEAGTIGQYIQNQLTKVSLGVTTTTTSTAYTTSAVPQVTTVSDVSVISDGGESVTVGLSGILKNLTQKATGNVRVEAPQETSHTTTSSKGWNVSVGLNGKGVTLGVGATASGGEEKTHRYVPQPLTVERLTTLLSDATVQVGTPFTTAYSYVNGQEFQATTHQDTHTGSQWSAQGNVGVTLSPSGLSPSFGMAGSQSESSAQTAPQPTVITATQGSVYSADTAKMVGASLIQRPSDTPGLLLRWADGREERMHELLTPEDGDCFFHGVHLKRTQAIEALRAAVPTHAALRTLIAPEIRAGFLDNAKPLPWAGKIMTVRNANNSDPELVEQLLPDAALLVNQEAVQTWKDAFYAPRVLTHMVERGNLATFQEYGRLRQRFNAGQSVEADLDAYTHDPQVIQDFLFYEYIQGPFSLAHHVSYVPVELNQHTQKRTQVTGTADALAQLNGFNLVIWQKTPEGHLEPVHEHIWNTGGLTRHLLHTQAQTIGGVAPTKARENLNHFTILNPTPGLFRARETVATDVVDRSHSESTHVGVDISFSGPVPGFVEAGFQEKDSSATHRSTLSDNYIVEGDAGGLNRDKSRMYDQGPSDSTHVWVGAPLITDVNQAIQDIQGGLNVLSSASQSLRDTLSGFLDGEPALQEPSQLMEKMANPERESGSIQDQDNKETKSVEHKNAKKSFSPQDEKSFLEHHFPKLAKGIEDTIESLNEKLNLCLAQEKLSAYANVAKKQAAVIYQSLRENGVKVVKAWNQTVQYVGEYLQAKAKQWRAEAPIKPVVAIVDDAAAITALVVGTRIIVASLSALLVKKGVDDQLAKEVHKNKEAVAPQTQSKATSSSSGATPPDGWEPEDHRQNDKNTGKPNPQRRTNVPKAESPIWKQLKNYKGEYKTDGKRVYKWDSMHNDIEVFSKNGKHQGSMDPITGKMYKPSKGYTLKQVQ